MSKNVLIDHPCFSNDCKKGRMHLPVAKACNIACKYCDRRYDCVNESRPGVTSKLLKPDQVIDYIKKCDTDENSIKVIGIAGPGEPLYNKETFETLEIIRNNFDKIICLSTNGLLLSEKLDQYGKFCHSITVTVNTLKAETVPRIYDSVLVPAEVFIAKQLEGIKKAKAIGMIVKINIVAIKAVNDYEVISIAKKMKGMGVDIVNIINLIPQNKFDKSNVLSNLDYEKLKGEVSNILPILKDCKRCRADAVGRIR